MRILKETTKWPGNTANHIYIFNDSLSAAIAYVPEGSKTVFKFKEPLQIDRSGRTFRELEDVAETNSQTRTVTGSKGQRYYLTEERGHWTCSCPGFQFRGACKHVDEVNTKSS